MVQIIAGEKGKGKTKILLEKVNNDVKEVKGNIVYLDKNTKHTYELNNLIRLINVKEYMIENSSEFLGFICGIISQNHDIEKIYFDSFLKIACIENEDLENILKKLENISDAFKVDFILSISIDKEQMPLDLQDKVIVSL